MRKRFLLLIIAALTVSVTCSAKKTTTVASTIRMAPQEELYNQGLKLIGTDQYERAITKFSEALNIDSTLCKAYFNRAVAYMNLGKTDEALSDVNKALMFAPASETSNYLLLKGKLLYKKGDAEAAKAAIDGALRSNASSTDAMLDKAALQQASGNYEDAITSYNKIITLSGGSAQAFNELGNCYYNTGEKEKALDKFQKAYSLDSTSTVLQFNLARATLEVEKDSAKALKLVNNLIVNDIDNVDYYILKGFIYSQTGSYAEAAAAFDMALSLNSDSEIANTGRGIVFLHSSNAQEALEYFNKAIQTNPNYADAYLNRGIAKEMLADYEGACEDFSKASELGMEKASEYYTKQCK